MNRLKIPFFQRFSWVGGFTLTFVILVSHAYYADRTRQELRNRLQEKAVFINNFLGFTFSTALAMKDDITLLQVMSQLEQDQDVLSIVVADDRGEIRYSNDQNKIGEEADDPDMKQVARTGEPIVKRFRNSAGEAMTMVSPLKVQGRARPLGVVRFDMTFKNVDKKSADARDSFLYFAIGLFMFGVTLCGIALRKWVATPIAMLKNYIRTISPMSAEAHLPEGPDDLGQLNASINEMILKFKAEIQAQSMMQNSQTAQEGELIQQLLLALDPGVRLLLADRDNKVVADSEAASGMMGQHLLDLMQDASFGSLVSAAFSQEGQPARGTVLFKDEPYAATALRLPELFVKGIRTVILLKKEIKETPSV